MKKVTCVIVGAALCLLFLFNPAFAEEQQKQVVILDNRTFIVVDESNSTSGVVLTTISLYAIEEGKIVLKDYFLNTGPKWKHEQPKEVRGSF